MRRIVCVVLALPIAALAMTYQLEDQWVKNGSRFCKYSDGTVMNVGVKVCPLSIHN